MQLIVISPEEADPREPAVLAQLFDAGLERYHVRKPEWTSRELEQWIRGLPEVFRPHLVLHQHRELVEVLGLGGRHWRKGEEHAPAPGHSSRSCRDVEEVRQALGTVSSVFFGPVFSSISKPGHGPHPDASAGGIRSLLDSRDAAQRRTSVLALGGVHVGNANRCRKVGYDGAAVLGAVWQAHDPVRAFLDIRQALVSGDRDVRLTPLMCLTRDGLPQSHVQQAQELCAAGARLVQLRMKGASPGAWLETARQVVAVCRSFGAVCIVNDSVEIALASGADGVHLGRLDGDWKGARRRLGGARIIGGTVNDSDDARRAREAGCLDYVGVGPLRFTATKERLSPVIGIDGIELLIAQLEGLPAWAIGGIESADLPALRAAGAAGVAASGALFRGATAANVHAFLDAWNAPADAKAAQQHPRRSVPSVVPQ